MKTSVYDLYRKFEQGSASRVGAYLILRAGETVDPKYGHRPVVGKVQVQYPKDGAGRLRVFVWDWSNPETTNEMQTSTANGYGYDKLDAALDGCKFAGEIIGTNGSGQWKEKLAERGFPVISVI